MDAASGDTAAQTARDAAFRAQAAHCRHNGAPATARIIEAQIALMRGGTQLGTQLAGWSPDAVLGDALPLRLAGGLHHLFRAGKADALGPVYRGKIADQRQVDGIVGDLVSAHDAELLVWLEGPPQTNEAGRSASFMAGLLWLADRLGIHRFALNEIGASAGVNLLMDRFRFDLGGVMVGPVDSPVLIRPDWRGAAPPDVPLAITAIKGCDQSPIDLRDDAACDRLRGYIWPEMADRFTRMNAAISLFRRVQPVLEAADAADWVEALLATPAQPAEARVVHHSIVWQYIPADRQQRIVAALEQAGRRASADQPLVWLQLETNRATFAHELWVDWWTPRHHRVLLGSAHAHGAWVEWRPGEMIII